MLCLVATFVVNEKVHQSFHILAAIDLGDLAVLTLLDLLAAFDTVNHDTLLRRLATSYGLDG